MRIDSYFVRCNVNDKAYSVFETRSKPTAPALQLPFEQIFRPGGNWTLSRSTPFISSGAAPAYKTSRGLASEPKNVQRSRSLSLSRLSFFFFASDRDNRLLPEKLLACERLEA
jgi:hypothetical protein